MRFMNGLNQIIGALNDPKSLKITVETLGFQHLDLEVTPPRVVIFRDAIVDLLKVEMGARFTPKARDGWCTFLNYVGGSYIYVRVKFAERLKIISSSWLTATKKSDDEVAEMEGGEAKDGEQVVGAHQAAAKSKSKNKFGNIFGKTSKSGGSDQEAAAGGLASAKGGGDLDKG